MKLGALILMALEAHFRLRKLVNTFCSGLCISWQSVHVTPCFSCALPSSTSARERLTHGKRDTPTI